MNPLIHSRSSVKRFGGKVEDYIQLHELLDSPKGCMNNNSARLLTHNTWFIYNIIPKIFGYNIINSDGKSVDTVDIAMLHVAEDYKMRFVPTPQDFLKHIELQPWMHNGVKPIDNPIADEFASLFLEKLKLQVKELERTEKKSEENLEFSEN